MAGFYPNGKGKPGRKPKFRPKITRIKLNPEQAVLSCYCYFGSIWCEGPYVMIDDPAAPTLCGSNRYTWRGKLDTEMSGWDDICSSASVS